MKFLCTVIIALTAFCAFGQEKVVVEEIKGETSMGERSGFSVLARGINKNAYEKLITKELKDAKVTDIFEKSDKKVKVSKIKHDLIIDNLFVNEISDKVIRIICQVNTVEEGANIYTFYDIDSIPVTRESVDGITYAAVMEHTRQLGVKGYRQAVSEDLKKEEKALKDLQKEKKAKQKEIEKANKDIIKRNKDIQDSEYNIHLNEKVIDEYESKAIESKSAFKGLIKGSAEYDVQKLKKQEDEKRYKKTRKELSSNKKNIKIQKQKVKRNQQDIILAEKEIYELEPQIENQSKVVTQKTMLLERIK